MILSLRLNRSRRPVSKSVGLEELYRTADYITVHVPKERAPKN